jgi:hypothetical protein
MRTAARTVLFLVAVTIDASGLLAPGWLAGRPLLFLALAVGFGLRSNLLTGGAWGFAGGMVLGLLYADSSLGPRLLGGLIAGSVPVAMRRLLFWQRWPGQAVLGAAAALFFDLALLVVGFARGETSGIVPSVFPGLAMDAILTGAACPLLMRLMGRLEGRY